MSLVAPVFLLCLFALAAAAYLVRVRKLGRARYDRVERQGGSRLLSKSLMEMAYWAIQPLAELLVSLKISANAISWASLGFGGVVAVCLASGNFGAASVFALIAALLDALDGLVARVTKTDSRAGKVLDSALDRYVELLFLGGLVLYYRQIPVLLGLTLFAIGASFMVSYTTALAEIVEVDVPKSSMRRPERLVYLILGTTLSPITIHFFERNSGFPVPVAYPVVAALFLVAVVGNISALRRLFLIIDEVKRREAFEKRAQPKLKIICEDDSFTVNSRGSAKGRIVS